MPASASKDVAHTQVTDHRIPRVPNVSPQLLRDAIRSSASPPLVPFPDSPAAEADTRDLALAYESLANSGEEGARSEAERILRRSLAESPNDAATLSALAYEEQTHGDVTGARSLYQRALAVDPDLIDARTNLGVIEAQNGDFLESIKLLRGAFERAPGRSLVGLNLARVFCLAGETPDARATVDRVLEFNPDMRAAKKLEEQLGSPRANCGR
jgi:Flp pilus assembly protein TadD